MRIKKFVISYAVFSRLMKTYGNDDVEKRTSKSGEICFSNNVVNA